MLKNINDYIKTGIFGKTKTIIALQVALLNEHECYLEKCGELADLVVKLDDLKEKNTKYQEMVKTLKNDIKEKEIEIEELKQNQKKKGEYLIRKVPSGRPPMSSQSMNLKSRHYANGTVKKLKELEENRS